VPIKGPFFPEVVVSVLNFWVYQIW